ncbi:hypothetical protein MKX01_026743 [Papaver californicum]|nr:hypothetical protein MKX01_026743 [Papaver californicum]
MGSIADQTQEVVSTKDQAHLWNIIYGFADSLVLRCAVEIGISDIIKNNNGSSITLSELSSKLPIPNVKSDHLHRIVRYLVHLNILKQESCRNGGRFNRVYSLKPAGTLLLRDAERSMVPMILGMTEKEFMVPWHFMKEGLGSGGSTTAFERGMGMDIWKYLEVPGDMFKSVPSAQAILLKLILHDWTDEQCVDILYKCKKAIPKETGKVIIVDVALEKESEHELTKTRLILDIDMMVNTGGRERTADDWENLLKRAGFQSHKIRPIRAIQSVIEAFP